MCDGDVYDANIKDIDKKSDIATIKINPLVSQDREGRHVFFRVHWSKIELCTARLGDFILRATQFPYII